MIEYCSINLKKTTKRLLVIIIDAYSNYRQYNYLD